MSEYVAKLSKVRISPRKARLVADLVRNKPVSDALDVLRVTNKKASTLIIKLIDSAVANAENVATVDVDRLVVSEIFVDGGPMWKRFLPRAQGRATPLRKRTASIVVKVSES